MPLAARRPRLSLVAATVLGALVLLLATGAAARPVHARHVTVLIVAGQSNALGATSWVRDPTTGLDIFDRTHRHASDSATTLALDEPGYRAPVMARTSTIPGPNGPAPPPLTTPQVMVHSLYDGRPRAIFGPEVGITRELWAHGLRDMVVVKVAMAATSLGGPGPWMPPQGVLFRDLVEATSRTVTYEAHRGATVTIGAVYWYQGENDAGAPLLAADYRTNLTAFIEALRADLPGAGNTPVVLAEESLGAVIATSRAADAACPTCAALEAGNDGVRAADVAVAHALPHVAVVDTAPLARTGPGMHLTGQSDLTLGAELARASLALGLR